MNNFPQNMERFDAYLRDEMSAEGRMEFEQELLSNTLLRTEFEQYHQFIGDVHDGAEYAAIRQMLRTVHNKPGVVRKPFLLSPQFLIPFALAATIALLLMVVNPFIKQGNDTAAIEEYQYLQNYPATSNESQAESPSESAVMDSSASVSANVSDDKIYPGEAPYLVEIKSAPIGTAFLISKDGYFLTSKHLVDKHQKIKLQQKDKALTFEASVVYTDSLMDFAILKCDETLAETFKPVPFQFTKKDIQLGQDVFTLGYPKNEIVYTKGVISSERGYKSDSLSFEVSLASNPGYSGAPLFTYEGDLIGIVIANNTRQQSVTYVLHHHYITKVIENLSKNDSMKIDLHSNYTKRYKQHSDLVKRYRSLVFEVHL